MSTTSTSPRPPRVQWLIDSRPPSLTWTRPSPPPSNQPQLDLTAQEPVSDEATAATNRGVRMSAVKARWAARPRHGLPDAQQWSAAKLALAIIQTLAGQRPAAHPNRSECALVGIGGPVIKPQIRRTRLAQTLRYDQ